MLRVTLYGWAGRDSESFEVDDLVMVNSEDGPAQESVALDFPAGQTRLYVGRGAYVAMRVEKEAD